MNSDPTTALREALIRVRAHTSWLRPSDGGSLEHLLAGLLANIQRITDAALASIPPASPVSEAPDWLDSEAFYDLCQSYRHAPLASQSDVQAAWNALKLGIRAHQPVSETPTPPSVSVCQWQETEPQSGWFYPSCRQDYDPAWDVYTRGVLERWNGCAFCGHPLSLVPAQEEPR